MGLVSLQNTFYVCVRMLDYLYSVLDFFAENISTGIVQAELEMVFIFKIFISFKSGISFYYTARFSCLCLENETLTYYADSLNFKQILNFSIENDNCCQSSFDVGKYQADLLYPSLWSVPVPL